MPFPLPFTPKSEEALKAQSKGVLNSLGIGNIYDAGKALSLLYTVDEKMAELNRATSIGMMNVNTSTASKVFLDLLGNSSGIFRIFGENDDSLRRRVKGNVLNQQMGNETSIRLAVNAHPLIKKTTFIDYVYGSGSFALFVSPPDGAEATEEVRTGAEEIIDVVKAKGVKTLVLYPAYKEVRMTLGVRGTFGFSDGSVDMVALQIARYINSLSQGETMLIDHIRSVAVQNGADGLDFHSIYIDGRRVLPRDFPVHWDEQLRVDPSVADAIKIAA